LVEYVISKPKLKYQIATNFLLPVIKTNYFLMVKCNNLLVQMVPNDKFVSEEQVSEPINYEQPTSLEEIITNINSHKVQTFDPDDKLSDSKEKINICDLTPNTITDDPDNKNILHIEEKDNKIFSAEPEVEEPKAKEFIEKDVNDELKDYLVSGLPEEQIETISFDDVDFGDYMNKIIKEKEKEKDTRSNDNNLEKVNNSKTYDGLELEFNKKPVQKIVIGKKKLLR
jgi:hypothetical protein